MQDPHEAAGKFVYQVQVLDLHPFWEQKNKPCTQIQSGYRSQFIAHSSSPPHHPQYDESRPHPPCFSFHIPSSFSSLPPCSEGPLDTRVVEDRSSNNPFPLSSLDSCQRKVKGQQTISLFSRFLFFHFFSLLVLPPSLPPRYSQRPWWICPGGSLACFGLVLQRGHRHPYWPCYHHHHCWICPHLCVCVMWVCDVCDVSVWCECVSGCVTWVHVTWVSVMWACVCCVCSIIPRLLPRKTGLSLGMRPSV